MRSLVSMTTQMGHNTRYLQMFNRMPNQIKAELALLHKKSRRGENKCLRQNDAISRGGSARFHMQKYNRKEGLF